MESVRDFSPYLIPLTIARKLKRWKQNTTKIDRTSRSAVRPPRIEFANCFMPLRLQRILLTNRNPSQDGAASKVEHSRRAGGTQKPWSLGCGKREAIAELMKRGPEAALHSIIKSRSRKMSDPDEQRRLDQSGRF
jgi:hypothetical protein